MDNIDLIRKIAWSFHYTTGMEWEDLFQEAALACCEAMNKYSPNKGRLSTYLWQCMTKRLQTYLQEQDHYKIHKDWRSNTTGICSIEDVKVSTTVEMELWWESLSDEAYEIAKVVIASPKPYLELRNLNKSISRIKHVMKNNGWDWRKIRRGIADLRTAYSKEFLV